MKDLKGIYSALVAPFDKEGNLIEEGLREIVKYNIEVNKVDGLYVNGSSGENFLIDTETKKRIFKITKEVAKDKINLIAQVGSLDLNEACELGKLSLIHI